MKNFTNELGHMTKVAAMPISGKKELSYLLFLKISFSRTNRVMALKHGM